MIIHKKCICEGNWILKCTAMCLRWAEKNWDQRRAANQKVKAISSLLYISHQGKSHWRRIDSWVFAVCCLPAWQSSHNSSKDMCLCGHDVDVENILQLRVSSMWHSHAGKSVLWNKYICTNMFKKFNYCCPSCHQQARSQRISNA